MVEGARLESVYRSKAYRGFESLSLRNKKAKNKVFDFFYVTKRSFLSFETLKKTFHARHEAFAVARYPLWVHCK